MTTAIDQFLVQHFPAEWYWRVLALAWGAIGVGVGAMLTWWVARLSIDGQRWTARRHIAVGIATGLLFFLFVTALLKFGCQAVSEQGSASVQFRILYHLTLVALLVAATTIDLAEYVIPDQITIPGMILGVVGAAWIGNLQLVPLWIDWNDLYVDLYGGYIPEWIKTHEHLHGLAWSLAGLIAGAGLTWIVRAAGRLMLGIEAMGFGDVTLMGMIGSFLGWQAIAFVFLFAGLCGLVLGPLLQFTVGRLAVPFGPYLSVGAFVVLVTWRWLWAPPSNGGQLGARSIFGHPASMACIAGGSLLALVGLLTLLRLYRAIPIPARHCTDKVKLKDEGSSVPHVTRLSDG